MSFWSDLVGRIRGIFGRGRAGIPPLPPPIKAILPKRFIQNLIYGHIIYKGIKNTTPAFNIPRGMRTLEDFVEWGEKQEIEQVKSTHPLALEVYCSVVLDHELTANGQGFKVIKQALEDSITQIYPNFAGEIINYIQWGLEHAVVDEEQDIEAVKRFSRDGEDFQEYDISNYVEGKIRSLIG